MIVDNFMFKLLAAFSGKNESMPTFHDPTLYHIQTTSQNYTGKIAFQNDKFMKLMLAAQPKVVKILKENIKKVEIIAHA